MTKKDREPPIGAGLGPLLEVAYPVIVINQASGQIVAVNLHAEAWSAEEQDEAVALATEGARGSPPALLHSIVAHGGPAFVLEVRQGTLKGRLELARQRWKLTKTQTRVLALLVEGSGNKAIAEVCQRSPKTIAVHVSALLARVAVTSRGQLTAAFWQLPG